MIALWLIVLSSSSARRKLPRICFNWSDSGTAIFQESEFQRQPKQSCGPEWIGTSPSHGWIGVATKSIMERLGVRNYPSHRQGPSQRRKAGLGLKQFGLVCQVRLRNNCLALQSRLSRDRLASPERLSSNRLALLDRLQDNRLALLDRLQDNRLTLQNRLHQGFIKAIQTSQTVT
jgi:hypothetical protein